jgi:hypothetical protein
MIREEWRIDFCNQLEEKTRQIDVLAVLRFSPSGAGGVLHTISGEAGRHTVVWDEDGQKKAGILTYFFNRYRYGLN